MKKLPTEGKKEKVKINVVLRKTAGKKHALCDASIGEISFLIRKPIGAIKNLLNL